MTPAKASGSWPIIMDGQFPTGAKCAECGRELLPGHPYNPRVMRWEHDVPVEHIFCVYC